MKILIRWVRLVTPASEAPRGKTFGNLNITPGQDVVFDDGIITAIRAGDPNAPPPNPGLYDKVIEGEGLILMPGFVDCHTHACWAGSRLDEWQMKLQGATYLSILAKGGGIMSTVRAVREASEKSLSSGLLSNLQEMLAAGTTTAEVKSGYGLSTHDELKMLRAIHAAAPLWPGTLRATALLGHAIDPDQPDFVNRTINDTLPAVHAEFPTIPIDLFLEQGAWTLADATRLLDKALTLGHPIRFHADQFNSLGGVPLAIRLNARSVDHLEASTPADLAALGQSDTIAVGLPICGLHLDGRYANLRALLDAGASIALATNFNPGSAPSCSLPMAIATAVRHCGLTPHEAIVAATSGAARVLALPNRGRLQVGFPADALLLNIRDERELAFRLGMSSIRQVFTGKRDT